MRYVVGHDCGNVINLDPRNRELVLWAIATRADPANQVRILRERWDSMFSTCDMDEQLRQRTADKWQDVLGALITAPKPFSTEKRHE